MVTDASGTFNQTTREASWNRMAQARTPSYASLRWQPGLYPMLSCVRAFQFVLVIAGGRGASVHYQKPGIL